MPGKTCLDCVIKMRRYSACSTEEASPKEIKDYRHRQELPSVARNPAIVWIHQEGFDFYRSIQGHGGFDLRLADSVCLFQRLPISHAQSSVVGILLPAVRTSFHKVRLRVCDR